MNNDLLKYARHTYRVIKNTVWSNASTYATIRPFIDHPLLLREISSMLKAGYANDHKTLCCSIIGKAVASIGYAYCHPEAKFRQDFPKIPFKRIQNDCLDVTAPILSKYFKIVGLNQFQLSTLSTVNAIDGAVNTLYKTIFSTITLSPPTDLYFVPYRLIEPNIGIFLGCSMTYSFKDKSGQYIHPDNV